MRQVLLALLGYDSKCSWPKLVSAGYLHPSTMDYVNTLTDLGLLFRNICELIEDYRAFAMSEIIQEGPRDQSPNVYLNAILEELEITVLQDYKNTLIELNNESKNESACNIPKIFHRVKPYYFVMDKVLAMCRNLINDSCRGAQVLNVVCRWGALVPQGFNHTFERLVRRWKLVLFEQLESWLSLSTNPMSEEFFIRAVYGRHSSSYEIVEEMVPSFFDTALAEQILSIGVKMKEIGEMVDRGSRPPDFADFVSFHEQNIRSLRELLQEADSNLRVKQLFERWHTCLTRRIWSSFSLKAEMETAFNKVADYFFQQQGHLFDHLVDLLLDDPSVKKCPPSATSTLPGKLFSRAADRVHHTAHRSVVQLRFCWRASQDQSWLSCLQLELCPEMIRSSGHLLSPNMISRCNEIFRFLLRIRYSHCLLKRIWFSHAKGAVVGKATFHFVSALHFVISTLCDYQANVIREHCHKMRANLRAMKNPEALSDVVANFTYNLETALFVHLPDAWLLIDKLTFMCECLEALDFKEQNQINCAWSALRGLMEELFRLGNCKEEGVAYLSQLLLMLNYNDYFSSLSGSIRPIDENGNFPLRGSDL